MSQFGAYQATVNSTGNWTFVSTTIKTQTRNGNWDWVTKAQQWYGTGGTTDGGATPVAIPNSFYLIGSLGSLARMYGLGSIRRLAPLGTLPAKYCFEHNLMPTCLQ